MIGHPDAETTDIQIMKTYPYTLSMLVADKLHEGHLVLTGDAAHQVPPYGGMGLNTGIQSAHNLAWKLAAILRGLYGITSTGAVLIRPDGHVAFRAQQAPPDPGEFLRAALRTVLRIQ